MSRAHATVVFAAALILVSPAYAGSNFGSSAVLSWSRVAVVGDLTTAPAQPTVLYLLLSGAPDVRSMAVELKWSPNDLVGPCYYLVSMDSTATTCGWTSFPLEPPGVFDGDSSYTWGITFGGASRSCVTYLVGGDHCDGKPASFCLISVRTIDSNGEIDDLAVVGNATILGGTEDGCPVVAQDIYPHVATSGSENTFTIQGRELAQGTEIALVDDGAVSTASSVIVAGDTTATATIAIPSTFAGAVDVVVTTPTSSDTLPDRVFVADSSAGLAPVWELDVTQSGALPSAIVVANEFTNPAYSASFPIQTVRVNRQVQRSSYLDGHYEPNFTIEVAPLDLDLNGRPTVSSLAFVSNSTMSVERWTGKVAILAPSGLDEAQLVPQRLAACAVKVNLQSSSEDRLVGWDRSPDEQWMVVRMERVTHVFTASQTSPSFHISGRAYDGSFSKNGRRYATVVEDDRGKRWVLMSPNGIVREGIRGGDAFSQLELSTDGNILTFSRQRGARDPVTTVIVDVATGEEHILSGVPDGARYYSADGKTMVVLTPSPGSLRLFDVTDPLAPVELATPFEMANAAFITCTASGNGALVALQMLETDDNAHRTLTRVVVLDRNLQQRATVITRTELAGLQFEGHFLFVGTQRHPIPSYFLFNPTTQIKLYDLSGL